MVTLQVIDWITKKKKGKKGIIRQAAAHLSADRSGALLIITDSCISKRVITEDWVVRLCYMSHLLMMSTATHRKILSSIQWLRINHAACFNFQPYKTKGWLMCVLFWPFKVWNSTTHLYQYTDRLDWWDNKNPILLGNSILTAELVPISSWGPCNPLQTQVNGWMWINDYSHLLVLIWFTDYNY